MYRATDVRNEYLLFPKCTQWFWTWFTGKALEGQKPLIQIDVKIYLVTTFVLFFGSLFTTALLIKMQNYSFYPLIIPLLILTTGECRKLQSVIQHYCLHQCFFNGKTANRCLGVFISAVTLSANFEQIKTEHLAHHKSRIFCTKNDSDRKYLEKIGLTPGGNLTWKFFTNSISPFFHIVQLFAKLRTLPNDKAALTLYLTFQIILLGCIAKIAGSHLFEAYLVAYLLPCTALCTIASTLQLMSEHDWFYSERNQHTKAQTCSWGRFCGESIPQQGRIRDWLRWILLMIFYHLPVRVAVLPGDLPNHDMHHLYPTDAKDWLRLPYLRNKIISNNKQSFIGIWGLCRAIKYGYSQHKRGSA